MPPAAAPAPPASRITFTFGGGTVASGAAPTFSVVDTSPLVTQNPSAKTADVLDFRDISLINSSTLPSPSSALQVTDLIRVRRRAAKRLEIGA